MRALFPGILLGLLAMASGIRAQLPEGIVDTQPGEAQPPGPGESVALISVPEGFRVSLFAGEPDVAQPIAIEYDDRGRLWVLESFSYIEWKRRGKDRLLIFEDTDNDGRFDKRTVFWDRGNHTSGFQIGFGGVWLCDAPELLFIPDADRDDIPDGEPRVVLDGWSTEAEHNFFNGLTWGPDGWLYGRHGIKQPSLVGKPGTPDGERVELSCCIWRFHPVKQRFEIWADGTINPWGLDWNEEGEGFINTSVIDHLWHLVPGARYRRWPGRGTASLDPHTYDLMEATSDHRHWVGGETERRDFSMHDDAGGGHSHCGMVIYQSESWPEKYRGRAFFSNVLGRRINMEHLEKRGSAWVATHGKDFLKSASPWFRAVDLRQGPHGEMMIAEWTDLGECHDRDGIHRSSGRLYEVWYGERPERRTFDLAAEETETLLGYLRHENVWWRRRAIRHLHERAQSGERITEEQRRVLLETAMDSPVRDAITAIEALHVSGVPLETWFGIVYAAAEEDHRAAIRIHLLTLTLTEEVPSAELVAWLEEAIDREKSPRVLYRMAALLQRIPVERRWNAAEALARVGIPPEDRNFSRMRWYGFEPLVERDPERAIRVAAGSGHPFLSRSIARRAVAAEALPAVIAAIPERDMASDALENVLAGLLDALPSRAEMPDGWGKCSNALRGRPEAGIRKAAFRLAQRFGDPAAEREMTSLVMDAAADREERREYLEMLVASRSREIAGRIPEMTGDPDLADLAIRAEAVFPTPDSAMRLLGLLRKQPEDGDGFANVILETLASRKDYADALVEAVLEKSIGKERLPSYIVRQLAMLASEREAFAEFVGLDREDAAKKAGLLAGWKKRLSEKVLSRGNPEEGREVFRRTCGACHRMYGEGGEIGPDLTGSGRADLDYFLINVLFPSEDVAPDYRLVTLTLKDGRTLTGNIAEENAKVITFRQVGQTQRIDVSEVERRQVLPVSLMPPGLLDGLKRDDIRDLVVYLRTKEPLP